MSFDTTKKNWEGLAQKDPYWAVCTHPDKTGQKWDQASFFLTGKREIDTVFKALEPKGFLPPHRDRALDFGCGLGRLSRALAAYFKRVDGVDVSKTMVQKARELHQETQWPQLHFHHNEQSSLAFLPDNSFSLVYTTIVLQHISYPESANYIMEFLRVLTPGGVSIFQVPIEDIRTLSLLQRIKSTLKIKERLALLGIGDGFNMEMNPIPEKDIVNLINTHSGTLLEIYYTNHTDPAFNGEVTFIPREASKDYVSALFVVRKLG